jgi:plasmid maintenance system antidote protein VapI
MPRQSNQKHRKAITELLAENDLGRDAHILENGDIVRLLRVAVEQEGSITAFATRHNLHRTEVSNILNGRRPVSSPLVKALGLRKVYIADQ